MPEAELSRDFWHLPIKQVNKLSTQFGKSLCAPQTASWVALHEWANCFLPQHTRNTVLVTTPVD